jgi:hypothetical protein
MHSIVNERIMLFGNFLSMFLFRAKNFMNGRSEIARETIDILVEESTVCCFIELNVFFFFYSGQNDNLISLAGNAVIFI